MSAKNEIRRRGRPAHEPTDETRNLVVNLLRVGATHDQIASAVKLTLPSLYKYYRAELDDGLAHGNAAVVKTAKQMALSGEYPAMTIFWLKTQCGWRESASLEISGPGGGAMKIHVKYDDIDVPSAPSGSSATDGTEGEV